MAVSYEIVTPTPIENAVVQKIIRNGAHTGYYITPAEGYVLHDKFSDWNDLDPETMEEVLKLGYVSGTISIGASYDFEANPREFYAVPADSVPADQIFGGGGGNDHEVM